MPGWQTAGLAFPFLSFFHIQHLALDIFFNLAENLTEIVVELN
jgi:hypothetical protein